MSYRLCNISPRSVPDWPSDTSCNGARDAGNEFKVPSFQTLMKYAERSNNQKREPVFNTSHCPDDPSDSFSVSSRSTAIPTCQSPVSISLDCGESQIVERPHAQSHDFWDTVLGQPQTGSLVHKKTLKAVRVEVLKLKPFKCNQCPLSFKKRCNLVSHISNVHKKLRPFYCSICLRRFARKSNCSKHMRIVHRLAGEAVKVLRVD